MQTSLPQSLLETTEGKEADGILRRCVHCGFCTATCPTYQLLGDELDGPRGRIYLVKQYLEGANTTRVTQRHLDQCLLCRACETTCPSGVEYARLIEISRSLMRTTIKRPLAQILKRKILLALLLRRRLFELLLRLVRIFKRALPQTLASQMVKQIGGVNNTGQWPNNEQTRKMLLLEGCVQPGLAPEINMSAARVLDQLGISVIRIPQAKCCGALEYHLEHQRDAIQTMKMTIDAWWPWIEKDVEAIVTTASGCGLMLHEYKQVFADDPQYRQKAAVIAGKIMDVSEVLLREDLTRLDVKPPATKIAFHPPCTLQHGLGLAEVVESILGKLGFNLARVKEKYLCCGSAGSYSLLQPKIANALRARKLSHLNADSPSIIATANIGCSSHLSAESKVPVVHWIELLDTTRNIDR